MTTITLPVSKYKVEIRDSITFGEFQDIDNFFQNRIKLKIVGNEQTAEVDGALVQQMRDKMIQTFLHSCRIEGGEERSTIGLLGTLDMEDGQLLQDTIADIYEGLKKKQKKTTNA